MTHTGCDYEDNGKGLQLDVEKILGTSQKEVWITFLKELWSDFLLLQSSVSDYGDYRPLGDYAFDEEMVEFI